MKFANLILIPIFLVIPLFGLGESHGRQDSQGSAPAFNREIRPILSNHCYACHGPDENARQAGLRLDIEGEADIEEILTRITSEDPDVVMPPPAHNKPLAAPQIEQLRRWIEGGAIYEQHWSLVPPRKVPTPDGTHPVDYFVDRQLAAVGAKRAPRAEPAVLIRRLYLDLIGIPPSIEEADAFLNEPTEENYARIVDRLLQSPRYGERWARRWLDLARYADTNGYEKDRDRNIWPYRDWVIRALNSGMPFDQFTIEQLAGDMLPEPTPDQLIATGFHRNTMLNEEGGIDPLEYRYYAMVDRVGTTGTTWLGLTVGCAQCHTHKYDPITHENYFGLMAYLNNADEPDFFFHTADTRKQREAAEERLDTLINELKSHWPEKGPEGEPVAGFRESFSAWLAEEAENSVQWKTLHPRSMTSNLPNLRMGPEGTIYASGDTTKQDTYTLEFPAADSEVSALRLEALPDRELPGGGPGLTFYEGRKGDFFLAEIDLSLTDGQRIEWGDASETYASNRFGNHRVAAELATDGDVQTGWSVAGREGFRHVAVFNLKTPIPAGRSFTVSMTFGRHFASSLGKFRLSVAHANRSLRASLLTAEESQLLAHDNAIDNKRLEEVFLMQAKPVESFADQVRNLRHPLQGISTLILRERPPEAARMTRLHHRGEYTQPEQEVAPHLPEALFDSRLQSAPTDRLEFAKWLVSRENPLTARVVANRHWQAFFGTGIVSTLDDFGMQGAPPSHPLLLDWLAVDLMDQGWSIKELHRLIVTSETYRQSSVATSENAMSERLLSRFPRRRLTAELIRDTALAASGLLNLEMFGPPVRPPQPEGVAANFEMSPWRASEGKDRYRRSVYTYQKRTAPFAMFATFDCPSGETAVARRDVSNTPLQALTLMNDPMFSEIAEAYGNTMAAEPGDNRAKMTVGFRRLLTRYPEEFELDRLEEFLAIHGDWTALARVLLCLDESINQN